MEASLEFIGTATTVLRLGPFTLLTDPNFMHRGERAYLGKGVRSRRLTEPSLRPEQLPPLDAVLLSHLHEDHFDPIARDRLDRGLPILTTTAASRTLRRWGFAGAHGMRSWETTVIGSGFRHLTITSVPGQHAPGPLRRLLPPVMGSVVELFDGPAAHPSFRMYITGDTLCRPWLREVVQRVGSLDAMMIHLGGTRVLGLLLTMDGKQGASLVEMLAPAVTVPVHHDDYTVFRSPLEDFLGECRDRGAPTRVRPVERGRSVTLVPAAT